MLVQSIWAIDVALGIFWKWSWIIAWKIVIWCGVVHVSGYAVGVPVHQSHVCCRCVEWSCQICNIERVVIVAVPDDYCVCIVIIGWDVPRLSKWCVVEIDVIVVVMNSCDSSHIIIVSHVLISWNNQIISCSVTIIVGVPNYACHRIWISW